jgi:hypothetical protein
MTREEFFLEACLRAMQGLLAASGEYRDEFITNPPAHMATAARQYAEELTQQVYGPEIEWPKERIV